MSNQWKLEDDVNDFVKKSLEKIGLEKGKDYRVESDMSDYLKEALKGSAKTKNKTNFGKPDFHLENYKIPVIIENKLGTKKIESKTKEGMKMDDASISGFAANGVLHYAKSMIESGKYSEVMAIAVAGNNQDDIIIKVFYVFGTGKDAYKEIENITNFNFLENKNIFDDFYKKAILTEEEKHKILIDSQAALQAYAKKLNKLMHNHNITAPQRVLYVSGMLLSMQDIKDEKGEIIQEGLTPEDLKGIQTDSKRDGKIITNQIEEFLKVKKIGNQKRELMLSSFGEISKDSQRDEITKLDKEVAKFINGDASTNKQIFVFIYENIYKSIDGFAGHIDIMGEMYSEFLKYALGDGKEIGIVLTPPYVTKMMSEILNVNPQSRVMDLATGSAGFLISAMELMINQVENEYQKGSEDAQKRIAKIKKEQLLGVELNAEMYTLAATNMILRGDGSSNIEKGNTFNTPKELYENFKANRLLLNPPFSFDENGMPFIAFGLDRMEKGGLGAIIIQDSAGSGKAIASNQKILKKHTLLASIKMPTDLFQPMAGVQTSIYIFEVGTPHDYDATVKFIDFRNDGYKRTSRALQETNEPTKRYRDIIKIYKAGKNAKVESSWNLDEVYVEDFITPSGADWNFDQHKKVNTKPTLDDFKKTVSDYLAWEVANILKKQDPSNEHLGK